MIRGNEKILIKKMSEATGVRVQTIKCRIFVSKGNQMANYCSAKKFELLKERRKCDYPRLL